MSYTRSVDCQLYRGVAGSTAGTLMTNVVEVTTAAARTVIERTVRNATVKTKKTGMVEASLTWSMRWKNPADADLTAIRSAFESGSPIALAALDAEDGAGLDADFYISKFERGEPFDDGVDVSVEAVPTDEIRAPVFKPAA